jgi:formate C-acetyltransferase
MSPGPLALRDSTSIGGLLHALEPLDLTDYPVVAVLDAKLPASRVGHRPDVIVPVIRRFLAAGGSVLQLNCVDEELLLEAQEHPDRHPDLVVRVSGYSAYFTTLPAHTQREIIDRARIGLG